MGDRLKARPEFLALMMRVQFLLPQLCLQSISGDALVL